MQVSLLSVTSFSIFYRELNGVPPILGQFSDAAFSMVTLLPVRGNPQKAIGDLRTMNDNSERGDMRMATTDKSTLYDELLDLLTEEANGDRLAAFRLPPEKQNRLELLLKKNADGSMSADERGELEEYERLEHLGRMLKARLRQKKNS